MANANPEQLLIDVIVDQIEDDEALIEGLGSGTLSLQDVERWRDRREETARRFLGETRRLISRMKEEGFGREMRTGRLPPHAHGTYRPPDTRRHPEPGSRHDRPIHRRFALDLADLGLRCTLHVEGDYDDVLELGAIHARHVHHLGGDLDSVRETVESAIVELQTTREAPEERFHGLRPEEFPSNEWANRTRGSGLSS